MFEKEIAGLRNELLEIFEDLHRHPEIGFAERRTSAFITGYLQNCGLEVTSGMAMTGVVGILDSGRPGKTLMIRADMDCLEILELAECEYKSLADGKMHACGHDSHVTMLLGAAKILSRHKDAFAGRIKFVFQPAEEGTPKEMYETVKAAGYDRQGGAGFMVEEGILDGVDACLVMHVQPALPVGTVSISRKNACASSDVFDITLTGKGGHGAQPQNAIDPVPAMAELITAIHMLPTREISAVETCVLSIGKVETPGSVWNAVAGKACISGGFRTFDQDVREHLGRRIEELAKNIANANRCTCTFELRRGYMPCINDESLAIAVAESCREVLGKDKVFLTNIPAMTSEDCGEYLSRVPGVFMWIGVGSGEDVPPLHSPYFRLDTEALPAGVAVHVNNAVCILNRLNGGGQNDGK